MELYIEDTIFVNFLTSFIICVITLKELKIKCNKFRFYLCIVLSIITSLVSIYAKLPDLFYMLIKLLIGFILSTILCLPKKIKSTVTCFLTFMFNTFLMGGLCFAIIGLSGQNIELNNQLNSNITVSIVLSSAIIYYVVVTKLLKVFYAKQKLNNYCYNINLTVNNITKNITGFLDTGNNIKYNNLPISIIPLDLAIHFDKSLNIISLLSKKKVLLKESCYIKYSTVSGQGNMLIFKPDKFEIKMGKTYFDFSNSYIGISLKEISTSNSFSILLNSQLI